MQIDQLFHFLVPLTFLAIWALTSLFNREAQPLPPRQGNPPEPLGPRPPGAGPVPRAAENPPLRWTPPRPEGAPAPMPRPVAGSRDEIIILDEIRRTAPPPPPRSRPAPAAAQRRPARPRTPTPAKRTEPATSRGRGGSVTPPMSAPLSQSMDVKPLSMPAVSRLSTSPSPDAPQPAADRSGTPTTPAPLDLRARLLTPERLRESFIMNEVLQPPLALRARPGSRRGI